MDWVDETGEDWSTRPQRQAGWRWLVGESFQWEKQKEVELESSGTPAKVLTMGRYAFWFLTNPLEVLEEGQAIRHCAKTMLRGCETGICWLVSIRRGGESVATIELQRTDEKWRIHQLAGKANRP